MAGCNVVLVIIPEMAPALPLALSSVISSLLYFVKFLLLLTVAGQKVSSYGAQITVEPVQICLMETFLLQTFLHSFYLSHKTSSV